MASGGIPSRKHAVIFSRTCLILEDKEKQAELNQEIETLKSNPEFDLYYTSHRLGALPEGLQLSFLRRGSELRGFIMNTSSRGEVVIICGAVDKDLHVASTTKSFLIAAGWVGLEPLVVKYGIPAPTPAKMTAILQIVANQTSWYYLCTFNDPVPTKVVSLCLANTYTVSDDEKAMAEAFQAILKDDNNNPVIKQALICHLMAAIAHDHDFRDVQNWAVAPSSSTNPPQSMEELKEHVRYMMNGRKPDAIFSRYKATSKSRFDGRDRRQSNDYCQKHFKSIHVSDKYRKKLKDRVVCVFDDYLTQGNTFEALRNLLVECQVKQIIFVSIGKFKTRYETKYKQRSFSINGDVYTEDYTAEFKSSAQHNVQFNADAQRSLQHLKELANYLK